MFLLLFWVANTFMAAAPSIFQPPKVSTALMVGPVTLIH